MVNSVPEKNEKPNASLKSEDQPPSENEDIK